MNAIKTKIGQIESNPMNPLDPSASSALENLRQQLSQALDYQPRLENTVANTLFRKCLFAVSAVVHTADECVIATAREKFTGVV